MRVVHSTSSMPRHVTFLLLAAACSNNPPPVQQNASSSGDASSGNASSSGTTGTCGRAGATPGFTANAKLAVDGKERVYSISIPPSYDGQKRFPVVFAFHGDGGNGAGTKGSFNFEKSHADEAIFVYPDGLNKTWDLDTWDEKTNRDMPFIDALVAETKSAFCTDTFFAVGFSRGGFFVNHLGCQRGDVFAAIASHGGGGPYDGSGKNYDGMGNLVCPTKPVPTLLVIGKNDGLLPDSQKSRAYWNYANGCSKTVSASTPAPCESSTGCMKAVEWCAVDGLGHGIWGQAMEKTWTFFVANK
jgi:polyhydroxybutyrate depolymerase